MRKLLLVACLVLVPTLATADEMATPAPMQHHLGVAPQVVLPMGDWADFSGLGFGLTLNYEYGLDDALAITGRLGYIHHLTKEQDLGLLGKYETSTTEIPVLAGVKYNFIPNVYGAAEFGLWNISTKVEDDSESNSRFGLTLGAGYEMENLAFGAQYILPNLIGKEEGEDSFGGLMFNVGYTFMGF